MMIAIKHISRNRRNLCIAANRNPLILGIESSCDDTGCAILRGNKILGDKIHSQLESHLKFGGVIPPVAGDFHRENIERIVTETIKQADIKVEELDAIAVTNRPGLTLSLLVGLRYAKHLSRKFNKPIIPVHHMEAHSLTVRLEHDVKFPFLCLLISGGHSLLAYVKDVKTFHLLGESLDDAPGEAFDKIARHLKMRNIKGFENKSGGQSIEEASRMCNDTTGKFKFPLMLARYRDCQFSFAGLKNVAKRHIQREEKVLGLDVDQVIPEYPEFCKSFLAAITRHICHRTQRAIEFCEREKMFENVETKTLVVSGGVACNDFIFQALTQMCDQLDFKAIRPSRKLCTDNGIMIAWAGVERYLTGNHDLIHDIDNIKIYPKCQLGDSIIDKVKEKGIMCKWIKIPILKDFAGPS